MTSLVSTRKSHSPTTKDMTSLVSTRKAAVVAIIGSAMTDLTCYADELPVGGQTLAGNLFTSGFGGKGANQVLGYDARKVFHLATLRLSHFVPTYRQLWQLIVARKYSS